MNSEFGGGSDIAFERRGMAGVVTLRRPEALNALTHEMVLAMGRALDAWEDDAGIAVVIVRGEGRAFSAGGDIGAIYRAGKAGRPLTGFFADEYRLNARIKSYPKPYVALIDGIVMGGGVGISVHGSHRVVTGKARFAMPEVSIGFFPDVGGSHFLPRLSGRFGYWLALTGARIAWGDCLWAGIASAAVPSERLEDLFEAVCASGDPDAAIARFQTRPAPETGEAERHAIERLFGGESLAETLTRLSSEGSEFSRATLESLGRHSPTSLLVTFRQLRAGAVLSMEACMAMEYRIVSRMVAGHDFYEGIRAAIIDKDGRPQWRPDRLEDVSEASIDAYFAPLGKEELTIPHRGGGGGS